MVFISENQLHDLLVSICDKHVLKGGDVGASVLATEALNELDPLQNGTCSEIYTLAHLHLRQLFRALLRKRFDPEETAEKYEQMEIPEVSHYLRDYLQKMYPIARKADEEPAYRHLNDLTVADREWNIEQMTKQIIGRTRHRDAFIAFWRERE